MEMTEKTNSLAGMLRWLGVGTFALGAVLFLLQGLDTTNEIFRNWSYLLLMLVVGGVGGWIPPLGFQLSERRAAARR